MKYDIYSGIKGFEDVRYQYSDDFPSKECAEEAALASAWYELEFICLLFDYQLDKQNINNLFDYFVTPSKN